MAKANAAPAEAPKAEPVAPVEAPAAVSEQAVKAPEAVQGPTAEQLEAMKLADQVRALTERLAILESEKAAEKTPGQRIVAPVEPYSDPPGVKIESHAAWRFDR